jgi:uncharacterized protein (TIGR00266 family)
MKYEIDGSTLPILTITLDKGESVYSQSGSLVSMSESINMSTELVGGITRAIRRLAGRETAFLTRFTSESDGAKISFSDKENPGTTKAFYLDGKTEWLCERASFLCSESTIDLDIAFLRKISAGLFGGEGFVFLKVSGTGYVFLHPYGEIKEHTLQENENLFVSTGKLVAFESTVSFNVVFLKKLRNMLFSKEGIFITKLTGPGKVYIQSAVKKDKIYGKNY